jgi:hypothetical protein
MFPSGVFIIADMIENRKKIETLKEVPITNKTNSKLLPKPNNK